MNAMPTGLSPATSFQSGNKTFDYFTDLEWFDGPWASLFLERKTGQPFYLTWVDRSETFHRWLFFPISPRSLRLFLAGKLSDDDLLWLDPSETVTLLELNGDMVVGEVRELLKIDLPDDFKPSPDGFFEPNLCPDLEKINQFLQQFPTAATARKLPESAAVEFSEQM